MHSHRWVEIQASFDELVELDASERAGQLALLATTDPELHQALESLLAADAAASARLAPLEAALRPQAAPAPDPLGLAGRAVSHFQVHEPIGAGGMGVVYRAEDTRLSRAVALKFLLPPYNLDAAAKARFLREAHSAAALDHRNLCTIHEVGTSDDGRLFLAMPLYPGETLKARLARDGPLPLGEALDVARQVAEGLKGAHAAGIVHRDLKPGNVMLLPDGTVKILDFGLAKARDQSLSETGARFGTVSYMAPEQIRGGVVDGRADLWALGVVLYEMLAGRKPFDGEAEITVAHAILHDEPISPSMHRDDVSASVEDLVFTLLQKDPARRCPTADELPVELARIRTVAGRSQRSLRTRWRRVKHMLSGTRRRMVTAGAVLVVGGTLGYTAVTPKSGNDPVAAQRTAIAVLPFRSLSAEGAHTYFAGGLHDEVLSQLHKVPALKVIGRNSVMSYSGPNTPPVRQIASELGVGSVVEGSVQVLGNRVRVNVQLTDAATDTPLWVERYDRTLDDAFALQSDIAQQIVATVGAALSSAERKGMTEVPTAKAEAYLLYLQGREYQLRPGLLRENFQVAQQLYERALALDPDFALARAALSRVHGFMYWLRYDMTPGRLARQREEAEAALRLAPNLPQAHVSMGHVYAVGPADSRAALEEYRIASRSLPNDPDIWRWIAQAHRRLGEWEQFTAPFEKAVQLDPRNADLLWDQGGGTHRRMGRYADAIRWYDRALSIAPDLHAASLAKAWVYVAWQGQLDTLRSVLNSLPKELKLGEGASRTSHHARRLLLERKPDSLLQLLAAARVPVLESVSDFDPIPLYAAWAHQLRGDSAAARAAFDSALALLHSAILKFPDDWPVHRARGMALAGLGRRDEALREVRWLQEGLIYRNDAFLRPGVAAGAAKILAQVGDAEASLDVIERLLAERPPGMSVQILRLDPVWDAIRQHPRFRALLAKHGK
jgi:serine/threonine protein kinase/tetratricopeptide (TPR) repeat protein